jgi:hypothetical protein
MDQVIAELNVEIALLPSAVQKRSDYRPNHKHPLTGEYFLVHVIFQDGFVDPGATASAHVRVLATQPDIDSLLAFGSWAIWEGPTHVGSVRIVDLDDCNLFKPNTLRVLD